MKRYQVNVSYATSVDVLAEDESDAIESAKEQVRQRVLQFPEDIGDPVWGWVFEIEREEEAD